MFTGLVKARGKIVKVATKNAGREISVDCAALANAPEIGASIALSGVCQTVIKYENKIATFYTAPETLRCTTLAHKKIGDEVNLESALKIGDALDGHLVSGHIDAPIAILSITNAGDSQLWRFALPADLAKFVAKKGSVAVDGISLTVAEVADDNFTVSVIPHTLSHTTLLNNQIGDKVNFEIDLLARYVAHLLAHTPPREINEEFLRTAGF